MGEPKEEGSELQRGARSPEATVVETRVVSPRGARVTERVLVLSKDAAHRLEIRGEVPKRQK